MSIWPSRSQKQNLKKPIEQSVPCTLPLLLDAENNSGPEQLAIMSPLSARFKEKLRPCLDVVDGLRRLGVSNEGITLPTIVVVGDQSSGKSSVLESLSRVELPKGQGVVTRVPLVLRLKGTNDAECRPKVSLSYLQKENIEITEMEIPTAIATATTEIAGPGKSIINKPITLTICRPGAPDLTLVDLPGITRVPVHGQPRNIFDTIQKLILQYITPDQTIILNVRNAAMDFSVCESIQMSRQVDKLGKRTLAVVTKVDMCPDGLLQKITDDDVKIGLGYICVRNRTSKEVSFEEAALAEASLFSSHAELKKLSKSMVGVGALASRLVQLQTQAIADALPSVLNQIDSSLETKRHELQQLSGDICNLAEASVAFFKASYCVKNSLEDILYNANLPSTQTADANNSSHSTEMNYNAVLHKEFTRFSEKITTEIASRVVRNEIQQGYLDCIQRLLAESLGTNLPNVLSQSLMERIVRKLIDDIASTCTSDLPCFVHDAALKLAFSVVARHVNRFPNLKRLYISTFQRALNDCKRTCYDTLMRILEMEKAVIHTVNAELYNMLLSKLLEAAQFNNSSRGNYQTQLEGLISSIDMSRLVNVTNQALRPAACTIVAYWIVLSRRLADQLCHELRFSFNEALLKVADAVVAKVLQGSSGVEEMMEEQPEVRHERLRLRNNIDMLCTSKKLVSQLLGDACL